MTIPNINFIGNDWQEFRRWLKEDQQDTFKRLASATTTEEETQRLRGRALFTEMLLDLHNNPAA